MAAHGARRKRMSHASKHNDNGPALIRTGKKSGVIVIPVKKKSKSKRRK